MTQQIIPLFGLGTKSKSVTVTSQSHTNVYAEVTPDADKTTLAYYGCPGLNLFTSFGDTPARGSIAVGDFMYQVHRGTFYEVNNAGVKVPRGIIGTTSGRVALAYNGLQIGLVDGDGMYIYNLNRTAQGIASITRAGTTATVTTLKPHNRYTGESVTVSGATPAGFNGTFVITVTGPNTFTYVMAADPGSNATAVGAYSVISSFVRVASGLFANPIDITYQGHVFAVAFRQSGFFQISGIDDGTTFDALDFASPESDPDDLVRVISDHGELVLCGTSTIEFWTNTGAQLFPYANQRGSELEFGLAAPWSMVKYNDSLAGLMKNKLGQVQVMMLAGHALAPMGTDKNFTDEINSYASVADATAYGYMLGGHPMYQINFPTAGKSWLFDATTNLWTNLESGLDGGRHLGEIAVDYLNKPRVSDYSNGNIYTLDPDATTDNGLQRPYEIVSRHVFSNFLRISIAKLHLDFETGVGLNSGQGEDPQAMLQISKDNGHTWGNELWTSMGRIGVYLARAIWRRLGSGRDFVFKIRVTEPIKFALTGAALTMSQSNEQ